MVKVNDRVKLTARHAATFTRRAGGRSGTFDWKNRRGVVKRISKRGDIFIQWDGRASLDQWPGEAIEEAGDDPNC